MASSNAEDVPKRFVRAALAGDLLAARELLAVDVNLNEKVLFQNGGAEVLPIAAAIIGGNPEIVMALLDHGCRIDEQDEFTGQGFFLVVLTGNVGCSRVLINDPRCQWTTLDRFVETIAGEWMSPATADSTKASLIEFITTGEMGPPARRDGPEMWFPEGPEAATILIARMLIEALERQNLPRGKGQALATGLARAARRGDYFLAELFMQHLPNTDEEIFVEILVGAAANANLAGLKLAAARVENVDQPNKMGQLALASGCDVSRCDIVEYLIERNANPNKAGTGQRLGLVAAAAKGNGSLVELLVQRGANIEGDNAADIWPLRVAIVHGRLDTVRQLLRLGADAGRIDGKGQTAMFLSSLRTDVRFVGSKIANAHAEVIAVLAAAGLDPNIRDKAGESAFFDAFRLEDSGRILPKAIFSAGAQLIDSEIARVLNSDARLLIWLLEQGFDANRKVKGEALVDIALGNFRDSAVFVALLAHGAGLPSTPAGIQQLLAIAAEQNSADLADGVFRAGGTTDVSPGDLRRSIGYLALLKGAGDVARLLCYRGFNWQVVDYRGETILHLLAGDDVQMRRDGRRSLLGETQIEALSVVFDDVSSLETKNREGLTALELANANAETALAFTNAIARSGTSANPLFAAVRAGDLAGIKRLIGSGTDPNGRDSLGRSALSLALALDLSAIAVYLLKAGAEITYRPEKKFVPADLTFATAPELAKAFRLRILKEQLVDSGGNTSKAGADTAIELYRQEWERPAPSMTWSVAGFTEYKQDTRFPSRSWVNTFDYLKWDISAEKLATNPGGIFYSIRRLADPLVVPIASSSAWIFTFVDWKVHGSMLMCGLNAEPEKQFCYPKVEIENCSNSNPIGEYEPLIEVKVTQNEHVQMLAPGQATVCDRTLGDIKIDIGPFFSPMYFMGCVRMDARMGEAVSSADDLSLESRMETYVRLATLYQELAALVSSPSARSADIRTIQVAIRLISAKALSDRLDQGVLLELRHTAEEIARMDENALAVRKAVVSANRLTSDDIVLLLAQLATIVPASESDRMIVSALVEQLERAKRVTDETGDAVAVLAENFRSNVDTVLADYQGLILEYAQYFPAEEIDQKIRLEPRIREAIAIRISASDVIIRDDSLDGKGRTLRQVFGLVE